MIYKSIHFGHPELKHQAVDQTLGFAATPQLALTAHKAFGTYTRHAKWHITIANSSILDNHGPLQPGIGNHAVDIGTIEDQLPAGVNVLSVCHNLQSLSLIFTRYRRAPALRSEAPPIPSCEIPIGQLACLPHLRHLSIFYEENGRGTRDAYPFLWPLISRLAQLESLHLKDTRLNNYFAELVARQTGSLSGHNQAFKLASLTLESSYRVYDDTLELGYAGSIASLHKDTLQRFSIISPNMELSDLSTSLLQRRLAANSIAPNPGPNLNNLKSLSLTYLASDDPSPLIGQKWTEVFTQYPNLVHLSIQPQHSRPNDLLYVLKNNASIDPTACPSLQTFTFVAPACTTAAQLLEPLVMVTSEVTIRRKNRTELKLVTIVLQLKQGSVSGLETMAEWCRTGEFSRILLHWAKKVQVYIWSLELRFRLQGTGDVIVRLRSGGVELSFDE